MVPRTRVGAWANAAVVTRSRSNRAKRFMGPPCTAKLTTLSSGAFHAQPLPGNKKNRGRALHLAAGQVPQKAANRVVRSQSPARAGRQLSRGTVVRPPGESMVRRHSFWKNFQSR